MASVQISKTLSYYLRHNALDAGLSMRPDGFVRVSELLRLPNLKSADLNLIKQIVAEDNKQRFKLLDQGGDWWIKANQGHSIKQVDDKELLVPVKNPLEFPCVVHGTYRKNWDSILMNGLNVMGRKHIHFATGMPGENHVISGMRSSCDIYIFIDLAKAMADGIPFFRSDNNVILSPGQRGVILPNYFLDVRDRNGQLLTLAPSTTTTIPSPAPAPSERPKSSAQNSARSSQSKPAHSSENSQPAAKSKDLTYILVLDFEATCEKDNSAFPYEIIELPVVVVDVKQGKVVNEFHRYVKPVEHPILSAFCTELTGIEQATVDSGVTIDVALAELDKWLKENNYVASNNSLINSVFATCGDWDLLKCFKNQAARQNLPIPHYFTCWCNVKFIFEDVMKQKSYGMPNMLQSLGLNLIGRHHSGIDDSRNIAAIVMELLKRGAKFQVTRSYKLPKK